MKNLNELNTTELNNLYTATSTTSAEKRGITMEINKRKQEDKTGVLDKIDNKEKENTGLSAIQTELADYFRSNVKQVTDNNDTLSAVACDLFNQAQQDDDYCIELISMSPEYVTNKLPDGVDGDIWKRKMIGLVYPNYTALCNDYDNKATQSKGSPANSKPVQDTERALQMLRAVDTAWKRLMSVLAWFEANKAIDVFYNIPLKLVSANVWQTGIIDGKEIEGNLSPALYYITAIIKQAPKAEQGTPEKTVGNTKAKDLSFVQLMSLVMDKITANGKPALPKELLTIEGLPILEKLEALRATIEGAVNDDVLTLMHNLREAETANVENDEIANRIASENLTPEELAELESNDMEDLEDAQQQANA